MSPEFPFKRRKKPAATPAPAQKASEPAAEGDDSTDPMLKSPGIEQKIEDGWEIVYGSTAGRLERKADGGGGSFRWVAGDMSDSQVSFLKEKLLSVQASILPVEEYTDASGRFAVTLEGPLVPIEKYVNERPVRPADIIEAVLDLAFGVAKLADEGIAPVAVTAARIFAHPEPLGIAGRAAAFRVKFPLFHELAPAELDNTGALLAQIAQMGAELLAREWAAPWHAERAAEFAALLESLSDADDSLSLDPAWAGAMFARGILAAIRPPRAVLLTDVGRVRTNNEDAGRVVLDTPTPPVSSGVLAFVADGMGGHAAGEIASRLALISAFRTLADFRESAAAGDAVMMRHIARAYAGAESAISRDCELHPSRSGMGTTLTGIAAMAPYPPVDPAGERVTPYEIGRAWVANLGDSRTYLAGDGAMIRLSHDHSYVQGLVDAGRIAEDEAFGHPNSNIISKCLGGNLHSDAAPDCAAMVAGAGDLFLMASDGLTDLLRDEEIYDILAGTWREAADPLAACAEKLVDAANERGGKDNITVILVSF